MVFLLFFFYLLSFSLESNFNILFQWWHKFIPCIFIYNKCRKYMNYLQKKCIWSVREHSIFKSINLFQWFHKDIYFWCTREYLATHFYLLVYTFRIFILTNWIRFTISLQYICFRRGLLNRDFLFRTLSNI